MKNQAVLLTKSYNFWAHLFTFLQKSIYLRLNPYSTMTKISQYVQSVLLTLLCCTAPSVAAPVADDDVVILFDNDVHGSMVGYPKMAALKQEMQRITPYVDLISLGDFAQGGPLCSVSHGKYAIDVMNLVGYDYVTLGNHEYDYGLEQLKMLTDSLHAETLLCNFRDLHTDSLLYKPYVVRKFGNLKVGLIGAVAPVTKTNNSPEIFVDSLGNDIFTFGRPHFYDIIQHYIDETRRLGADVVILLGHLGDLEITIETSEETIRRTRGLNAVLDGHAHHVINQQMTNADGDSVLLVSTGSNFQHIGRLVITQGGQCTADLIAVPSYNNQVKAVSELIQRFEGSFDNLPAIAHADFDLCGFDRAHDTYDRNCQTNLGLLTADAYRVMTKADIGWINAGGIRAGIPAGKITFKELLGAFPFENQVCVAEFTGQQILDALEFGFYRAPADNGSYPQLSGIRFDVDLSATPVVECRAEDGEFMGIGDGPRRIHGAEVLDRQTQQWLKLDPQKAYTVASIDFILLRGGCNGMLRNGRIVQDNQMKDTQILEDYLVKVLHRTVPERYQDIRVKL